MYISKTSSYLIIIFCVVAFSWRSSRARTAFYERCWSITALTRSQTPRHNEPQTIWERDSGQSRRQKALREWHRTEVDRMTYAGLCSRVCLRDWILFQRWCLIQSGLLPMRSKVKKCPLAPNTRSPWLFILPN